MEPLIVLAVLAAVAGILFLSQATLGVGLVGLACLFAIFARMAQASTYNEQLPHHVARKDALRAEATERARQRAEARRAREAEAPPSPPDNVTLRAFVGVVVVFSVIAAVVIYQSMPEPAADRLAATDAATAEAEQRVTPLGISSTPVENGLLIENRSEQGWADCLVRVGANSAEVGDLAVGAEFLLATTEHAALLPDGYRSRPRVVLCFRPAQ